MRVFLGIILGFFLTVAGAYVYDSVSTGPTVTGQTPAQQRTMVNWDVVGDNWRSLKIRVHDGWQRLSSVKT
jgi:hypothetical protein